MDVLQNKAYKEYNRLSRYASVPYYYHRLDDKYIHGTSFYLKDTTPFTSYIVKRNDTLDSLALKFYNNPTYYWIIASFNRITDPYVELEVGSTLKIPSMSNLEFDN